MKKAIFIALLSLFFLKAGFAADEARLLRFPTINKDLIAFVYAGDIWTVPASGGEAKRMTSHVGLELFPKISPDGKWIAFSAEYSGTRQLYVMPAEGGSPKQLTYYNDIGILPPRGGYDYIPLDWTPDSKQVLFLANRTPYDERIQKYYLINIDGGQETPLQIPEGGFGTFSPDAKKIVYAPISREFRTWKRYKGGRAQDIWLYDLQNDKSERLTYFTGTDQHPFWHNDKIFFVSDRDLVLNFWSYDLKTKEQKQVTFHKDFDAIWPSGRNGLIAYENGGFINVLNLNTLETKKITVNMSFDNPNTLPVFKKVSDFISNFGANIGPEGKRAVFDARGDLFTVPAEKGVTVNLTRTSGVREMYPVWSPDGKWIAYISDKTGDYEIYIMDPEKKRETVQLTQNTKVWKFPPIWSPDSKKMAVMDIDRKFHVLDVQTKTLTLVDKSRNDSIGGCDWSSDSKWITYTKEEDNHLSAIWVYSLETGKTHKISSGRYGDDSPIFSKCGKYIFFTSSRDFDQMNLSFSSMEFNYLFNKNSRVYAIALTKNAPNLFKEENDLEKSEKPEAPKPAADDKDKKPADAKGKDKAAKPKEEAKAITIDFDGIEQRISVFPFPCGNYGGLFDLGGKLLYSKEGEIRLFDLKSKDDKLIMKGGRLIALSSDNKKMFYRGMGKYGIADIRPEQKPGEGALNLDGLEMKIDPKKEWEQTYNEAWRIFRDWFYVRNMHGVDWQKMKEKYAPLVKHLGHRADLEYIFGELIGELNCGHTYANWGDFERPNRIEGGLLGAELKADSKAGRYLISKIFKGENWNEDTRSPLTEQGINIKEGEYIISIDGNNVTTNENPYKFLENTFGKKIPITVNSTPTEAGARTYWISPIKTEVHLRYMDWVETRRKMVDELSGGRIGYIHMPNTGNEGNREFFKGLYAYNDKDAFIIDDRYNGGGWIPVIPILRMMQYPLTRWHRRDLTLRTDPQYTLHGPKVMLINHYSSSGGDDLPYLFKSNNLGPLIGTRTWGGLVGYSWSPELVDGSNFAVPMSGIVGPDGKYAVEGTGVNPDIEVYDIPEAIAKGKDPSLETAIKYLLEELKKNPPKKVKDPSDPNRSKWHEDMPNDDSTGFNNK